MTLKEEDRNLLIRCERDRKWQKHIKIGQRQKFKKKEMRKYKENSYGERRRKIGREKHVSERGMKGKYKWKGRNDPFFQTEKDERKETQTWK